MLPLIFLMLPDTPQVDEVLFGPDGVAEGVQKGAIVVDMSSISPIATRRFSEQLLALGVEMLDAPVSGGQIGAENATLSIMVGGKESVFLSMKPYLELMGKNIVHIGGSGDGQVCKMANQVVVALTLEAVSEALVLASKAGADPIKVRQALLGGFAQSKILEVHGERMLKRTFQPGFRVRLHQKDLNIALQVGRELGCKPSEYGHCTGIVQYHLCRRWQRSRPLRHDYSNRKARQSQSGIAIYQMNRTVS